MSNRITDYYKNIKKRKYDLKDLDNELSEYNLDDEIDEFNNTLNQTNLYDDNRYDNVKINRTHNLIINQNNKSTNLISNENNRKRIKKNQTIESMRNVFERAQLIKNTQSCLNELHNFLINFEFDEFYSEFCRDLKCTLQYEFNNPKVKNILNTISSFLLSLKLNYSELNLKKRKNNFSNQSENSKKSKTKTNSINDENISIDELSSLIFNNENEQPNIINTNHNLNSINSSNSRSINSINSSNSRSINSSNSNSSTILTRSKTNKLKDSTNNLKNFKESTKSIKQSKDKLSTTKKDDNRIHKIYFNLLEYIIGDVLIPLLLSIEENKRLNCCFLIGKLINSIEDLETNLFARLKLSIRDRLIDKSPKVRAAAVLLLYRFQDKPPNNAKFNNIIDDSTNSLNQIRENQDVEDGLAFHLKYDPSPLVRLNCLNVILVNDNTLPIILTKIRDINNGIREKTFIKLSKKINFKQLDQNDKLFIIKNGLNDRKENVLKAFKDYCIPSFVKSYNNNLVDLIIDLNLDCNHQLIEQFLINYFDTIYSKDKIIFNKFHKLIIDFCKNYLDNEFLIKIENNYFATFFLWTNLFEYLKKKEFELDKQFFSDKVSINELRSKLKSEFILMLKDVDIRVEQDNETINQLNKESIEEEYTSLKDKLNLADSLGNDINKFNCESNVPIIKNQSKDKFNNNSNKNDEQSVDENNNESEIIGLSRTINIPPIQKNQQIINVNRTINLPIIDDQLDDNDYSLVDLITPKFTKFIQFFKLFCFQLNDKDYNNDKEILIDQLILEKLVDFLRNYEINDNYQKTLILQLIDDNLINLDYNVTNLDNYIDLLLNYVNKNVLKNKKEFFKYSFELQNKLESNIDKEELERSLIEIKFDEIRKLEVINANKTLKYHELKDQLDNVIAKCEFDKAHEIQKEIELIKEECNKLNEQIIEIKEKFNNQNNEKEHDNDSQYSNLLLIENPIQHFKLIKIFQLTINFCCPNRINSIINAKFHKYILSGILSENPKIRYEAIKALNELCYINLETASTFYPLYVRICIEDNEKIQALALKGLIDFVLEHGLDVLYETNSNSNDQNLNIDLLISSNNISSNTTLLNPTSNSNSTEQQLNLPRISITSSTSLPTPSKTTSSNSHSSEQQLNLPRISIALATSSITDEELINKSHFIEPTLLNPNEIELNKQITKEFVKFILNFVKSNNELIKSVSVMGICKLAFLRIYSPKLLSELILLWYNSSTSQSIIHDIGSFLPIYCLTELTFQIKLPSHLNGQNCLLECFMYTVESFYRLERGSQLRSSFDVAYSNYYDSDIDVLNVIEFMLNLLEPINHGKILLEFCMRISEIICLERDDEYELNEPFITRYLIPSLNSFKLSNITNDQLDNLKELMLGIISSPRFNTLKKRLITKLVKFNNMLQSI